MMWKLNSAFCTVLLLAALTSGLAFGLGKKGTVSEKCVMALSGGFEEPNNNPLFTASTAELSEIVSQENFCTETMPKVKRNCLKFPPPSLKGRQEPYLKGLCGRRSIRNACESVHDRLKLFASVWPQLQNRGESSPSAEELASTHCATGGCDALLAALEECTVIHEVADKRACLVDVVCDHAFDNYEHQLKSAAGKSGKKDPVAEMLAAVRVLELLAEKARQYSEGELSKAKTVLSRITNMRKEQQDKLKGDLKALEEKSSDVQKTIDRTLKTQQNIQETIEHINTNIQVSEAKLARLNEALQQAQEQKAAQQEELDTQTEALQQAVAALAQCKSDSDAGAELNSRLMSELSALQQSVDEKQAQSEELDKKLAELATKIDTTKNELKRFDKERKYYEAQLERQDKLLKKLGTDMEQALRDAEENVNLLLGTVESDSSNPSALLETSEKLHTSLWNAARFVSQTPGGTTDRTEHQTPVKATDVPTPKNIDALFDELKNQGVRAMLRKFDDFTARLLDAITALRTEVEFLRLNWGQSERLTSREAGDPEARAAALLSKIAALTQMVDKLQQDRDNFIKQTLTLSATLKALQERFDGLTKDIKGLETRLEQEQTENAELQRKYKEIMGQLEKETASNQHCAEELAHLKSLIQNNQQQVADKQKQNQDLQKKITGDGARLELDTRNLQNLEQEKQAAQEQRNTLKSQCQQVNSQIKQVESIIGELKDIVGKSPEFGDEEAATSMSEALKSAKNKADKLRIPSETHFLF